MKWVFVFIGVVAVVKVIDMIIGYYISTLIAQYADSFITVEKVEVRKCPVCSKQAEMQLEQQRILSQGSKPHSVFSMAALGGFKHDPVNHPSHYTSHPSGVECIEVTRHMTFNIGNAVKYLWRNGLKDGNPSVQDLKKAVWYIEDEITRLKKGE